MWSLAPDDCHLMKHTAPGLSSFPLPGPASLPPGVESQFMAEPHSQKQPGLGVWVGKTSRRLKASPSGGPPGKPLGHFTARQTGEKGFLELFEGISPSEDPGLEETTSVSQTPSFFGQNSLCPAFGSVLTTGVSFWSGDAANPGISTFSKFETRF